MSELTYKQAQALAALIHELRGDWDTPGIEHALGQARTRATGAEVAVAAIRASTAASNRTPAVIALDGPHWREPAPPEKSTHRPPRKDETCKIHAGSWAHNCAGCRADQLAGDQTAGPNLRRPDVTERLAQLRAAVQPLDPRAVRHTPREDA